MSMNDKLAYLKIKYAPLSNFTTHAAASDVPWMSDPEWREFKADVAEHGISEPITCAESGDGKNYIVLDGRHRHSVAVELGIKEIPYRLVDIAVADQSEFIYRTAVFRRQLSPSRRAMLAAKIKPRLAEAAVIRMKAGKASDPMAKLPQGPARDQAAEIAGVSPRMVDDAATVLRDGSKEIIDAVERGEVTVSRAAKVVKAESKPDQLAVAKEKPAARKPKADVLTEVLDASGAAPAVVDGDMATCIPKKAVPAKMARAFSLTAEYDRVQQLFISLNKAVKALADSPAGVFLHAQSVLADLKNAQIAVKFAKPYDVCPACGGKGCDNCKKSGWVTKDRFERTPKPEVQS